MKDILITDEEINYHKMTQETGKNKCVLCDKEVKEDQIFCDDCKKK